MCVDGPTIWSSNLKEYLLHFFKIGLLEVYKGNGVLSLIFNAGLHMRILMIHPETFKHLIIKPSRGEATIKFSNSFIVSFLPSVGCPDSPLTEQGIECFLEKVLNDSLGQTYLEELEGLEAKTMFSRGKTHTRGANRQGRGRSEHGRSIPSGSLFP